MEERRQLGFHQRPKFGEVLAYIEEGEPLNFPLPNRKATIYTSSHYWLDDFPQSTEYWAREDAPPRAHTGLRVDEDFETAAESDGYSGRPFPRIPRRELLRPGPDTDSESGPDEALRRNGMNPPRPPQASSSVSGRIGEAVLRGAEGVIAAGAAGVGQGFQTRGEQVAYQGLGRAAEAVQRRAPQIIGRPSDVDELLTRAGQRAQEVERAAAQDVEQFAAEQAAAETGDLVPLIAETAEAGTQTAAAAASSGGGVLSGAAAFGGAMAEGAGEALAVGFPIAEAAGMAAGVATGGAAALAGGAAYGIYQGGRWLLGGGNGGDAASGNESAPDVRTLNGMQQGDPQQHLTVRQPRRVVQPQVVRMNADSENEAPPQALQPRPQVTSRPRARRPAQPFGINPVQLPSASGSESRGSGPTRRQPPPQGEMSFEELRRRAEPEAA